MQLKGVNYDTGDVLEGFLNASLYFLCRGCAP